MDHNTIVDKLTTVYPGSHWTLTGETYSGFVWLDDPATKPSASALGF